MNRLVKIIVRNLVYVPKTFYRLFRFSANDKISYEKKYQLLRYIAERSMLKGDINLKVYGLENIPKEDGFIFYPNHQGIFDGFAMVYVCPRPFSPVIKKEIMDYPIVKQIFMCMESFPMDREDVRQSMEVMKQVEKRVKEGRNCLIFPEGTRSKCGNQLNEFKGGCFRPAIKTKCPIVPVALIDSYKPFDQSVQGTVTVQVHILEPIYYEEYASMKTTEISELVKKMICQTIAQHESKGEIHE